MRCPAGSVRVFLVSSGVCLLFAVPSEIGAWRPPLTVVAIEYRDLDGDRDPFPDTGETGRLVVTVRNNRTWPTGTIVVHLVSDDPDVDCIPSSQVTVSLDAGATAVLGSHDPSLPGFTLRASDALATLSAADPARLDLCLRVQDFSFENFFSTPFCFSLVADLDLGDAPEQRFIDGPDGAPGTPDDGTILETFDVDADGDGALTVRDTFLGRDEASGLMTHGFYQRGAAMAEGGTGGVACGGFRTADDGNAGCRLDPDFPMDWHLHCAPGAANCPNVESGACAGGCSYGTPADGRKALSAPNSLHMGAHFNALASGAGDTTHLRAIQAFVSPPINLAVAPRPGDLTLSMFHIASLMDNNGLGSWANEGQCQDCAQLQIQPDTDADPAIDAWGFWETLAPFQNAYDHLAAAWSAVNPIYCRFTPADTGAAAPAPRGAHETMCYPQAAWSHCGHPRGDSADDVYDCEGPGIVQPGGNGVWVESRFDLRGYVGRRVRLRWIGSTWRFDDASSSYFEAGGGWDATLQDDGWWLDNLAITGAITRQMSPAIDSRPAPATACPADYCPDLDGDGYGAPGRAGCPGGPEADCEDTRPGAHPQAAETCNGHDDDCDGSIPADEADWDLDRVKICEGDCDDFDPSRSFYAAESNDRRDNQCPGAFGYGVVDEITGGLSLFGGSATRVSWRRQTLATEYDVVRMDRPNFGGSCRNWLVSSTSVEDADSPPPGVVFYYSVRARLPNIGSFGVDSAGNERHPACAP